MSKEPNALDAALAAIEDQFEPGARSRLRSRPPERVLHIRRNGRSRYPGDAAVIAAVHDAGRSLDPDARICEGWAYAASIAARLYAPRSTAVRWCRKLATRGLLDQERVIVVGSTGGQLADSWAWRFRVHVGAD